MIVIALKTLRNIIIPLFIFTLSGCDNKTEPPLRLAHSSWPGYEALTLAKTRSLYENINVTLHRPSNNSEAMQAFENGLIDVIAITLNSAIAFQSRTDEPLIIIAVLDISDGGDVIIANKNIKSVKDLKGKRLGIEPTAFGAHFATRAIETAADFTLNELHIVPITIDNHQDMLLSHSVDAIATYEPVTSEILKMTGHIIFDSSRIPNEIIDVLVTKESYANSQSEKIKELIRGYFKALEFINKQPNIAIAEMAAFEDIDAAQYKKSLEGIRIPDLKENQQWLGGTESKLKIISKKMEGFLKSNNIIKQDNTLLPKHSDRFLPTLEKK